MPRTPKTHTNGYASAADLLAADDLKHLDVMVDGWKVAGVPARIRVRGLTLPERETVMLGRFKDGKEDEVLLAAGYLRFGVEKPALDEEQALALAQKHAGTVTYVAKLIQGLTDLDYDLIQAIAGALAAESGDTSAAPDPAPTP